jgi:hypothetical protein
VEQLMYRRRETFVYYDIMRLVPLGNNACI